MIHVTDDEQAVVYVRDESRLLGPGHFESVNLMGSVAKLRLVGEVKIDRLNLFATRARIDASRCTTSPKFGEVRVWSRRVRLIGGLQGFLPRVLPFDPDSKTPIVTHHRVPRPTLDEICAACKRVTEKRRRRRKS